MMTKDNLKHFMSGFGFKPKMTRSEIKQLPALLYPDETLLALVEGQLKKIHCSDITGYGLVIATDQRIVFFRKSFIGIETKAETPLSNISSIHYREGLFSCSIEMAMPGKGSVIEHCNKILGKKLIDAVQKSMLAAGNTTATSNNKILISRESNAPNKRPQYIKQEVLNQVPHFI